MAMRVHRTLCMPRWGLDQGAADDAAVYVSFDQ